MKKIDMARIDWPHIGMTLDETARVLRVHPRTVQIAIMRGGLPARKVGVSWRIDPDAVRAWLAADGRLSEDIGEGEVESEDKNAVREESAPASSFEKIMDRIREGRSEGENAGD